MLDEFIKDEEILFRAVPPKPDFSKKDLNKPSSALFKDKKGVSADRQGERELGEIINTFEKRKPNYGLVSILAQKCRELETLPLSKPLDENIYHAEIHDSEENIELSKSKARKLSSNVEMIKKPF